MITQADLDAGVIANIQKDAKSKSGPTQSMTGGKKPELAPETELKPDATALGAGATDLVGRPVTPDTSKGLGPMNKLNMITKMYGSGTGLA